MKGKLKLSDGEWRLMNLLWQNAPRTIAQMVNELKDETGWKKKNLFLNHSPVGVKGAGPF